MQTSMVQGKVHACVMCINWGWETRLENVKKKEDKQ